MTFWDFFNGLLDLDPVERGGVAADDGLQLVLRDTLEIPRDHVA